MKSLKSVFVQKFFFGLISCAFGFLGTPLRGSADPLVLRSGGIIPDRYIVTVDPGHSVESLVRDHGFKPRRAFRRSMNGFAAKLSHSHLARLRRDPRVRAIEADQLVYVNGTQASPSWGLDRIDQRQLPLNSAYAYKSIGTNVTAYIIDTGIRTSHQEFGGRASVGFDAFGGDGQDCHGHGTHVAGTVGGTTYGVAKNASLVSVRVLSCEGWGTVSGVIDGIEWVANHRVLPAVANLSLGGGPSDALDAAIEKMISSGVTTVVAAGNEASDACGASPARVSSAITVGASDSSDVRAGWSNYGSCVDWFAPGANIVSAWGSSDTAAATLSGTSMAAPHTTGVAALYLETHPTDSPSQVRDALFSFTSKGRVTSSLTANNHLLYSMEEVDGGSDAGSPVTSITSPMNGVLVRPGRALTIKAQASSNLANQAITRVEFFVNGSLICTDTRAPYTCYWRVPRGSSLSYDLQSVVYDADGNQGSSSVISVTSR